MNPAEAVLWLTLNCMKEGPFEPPKAQQAISHVVLNRAKRANSSVATELLRKKQFSWTVTSKHRWVIDLKNPPVFAAYSQCVSSSMKALSEKDFTGGAEYYHRYDINPLWAKEKNKISNRYGGVHIFYKDNNSSCDYCKKPVIYDVSKYSIVVKSTEFETIPKIEIAPEERKIVVLTPDVKKTPVAVEKTNNDGVNYLILILGSLYL